MQRLHELFNSGGCGIKQCAKRAVRDGYQYETENFSDANSLGSLIANRGTNCSFVVRCPDRKFLSDIQEILPTGVLRTIDDDVSPPLRERLFVMICAIAVGVSSAFLTGQLAGGWGFVVGLLAASLTTIVTVGDPDLDIFIVQLETKARPFG
jgi:hypothetical protein